MTLPPLSVGLVCVRTGVKPYAQFCGTASALQTGAYVITLFPSLLQREAMVIH